MLFQKSLDCSLAIPTHPPPSPPWCGGIFDKGEETDEIPMGSPPSVGGERGGGISGTLWIYLWD
ncbi:MAG: hypothetical protein V1758_00375, partial [Pseudomonadota bacterium]